MSVLLSEWCISRHWNVVSSYKGLTLRCQQSLCIEVSALTSKIQLKDMYFHCMHSNFLDCKLKTSSISQVPTISIRVKHLEVYNAPASAWTTLCLEMTKKHMQVSIWKEWQHRRTLLSVTSSGSKTHDTNMKWSGKIILTIYTSSILAHQTFFWKFLPDRGVHLALPVTSKRWR